MQYDPNDDPERQFGGGGSLPDQPAAPSAPTTPRITGPVTDPNDPRLADPEYASDPDVLAYINSIYGPGGTAFNPPTGTPGWNPNTQEWNPATQGPGPGTPGAPDPGGGGGNTTGGGTTTSPFPTFTAPGFTPQQGLTPPNPYTFTPFSYKDFSAPTLEDAKNQPGYLFGLQQGQDALQNAAAARGTLRGGGTLKDLFGYTNAAAEQNYGNVFNQQKSVYDENRDNAFGSWAANNAGSLGAFTTNWGVAKDVNTSANNANQTNYQNAFQNAGAEFNPLFNASTLTFQDSYNRWLAKLNSLTNIATAGAA